jgi:hypothetical protein
VRRVCRETRCEGALRWTDKVVEAGASAHTVGIPAVTANKATLSTRTMREVRRIERGAKNSRATSVYDAAGWISSISRGAAASDNGPRSARLRFDLCHWYPSFGRARPRVDIFEHRAGVTFDQAREQRNEASLDGVLGVCHLRAASDSEYAAIGKKARGGGGGGHSRSQQRVRTSVPQGLRNAPWARSFSLSPVPVDCCGRNPRDCQIVSRRRTHLRF